MLLFLVTLTPSISEARFANIEEATVEVIHNLEINVFEDGTSEEIVEQDIKVLNEAGREGYGTQYIIYNGDTEKVEILEAKTILNGKEFKVEKEALEVKPLASAIQGFDQKYQILVAYPQVIVGSRLYLKYKKTTTEVAFPKYFSTKGYYGGGVCEKDSKVIITSKLPLHLQVNDPHQSLLVKEDKMVAPYSLTITMKKPVYTSLKNENGVLEEKYQTWFKVSTVESFNDIAKAMAPAYEKVVNQPLPAEFEAIRKKAQKAKDEISKINVVTSHLANTIRYMGDWRSIKGKYFPRDLKKIVSSGVADCKDYATSTAAILRKLGFQVNVSTVWRGGVYLPSENPLPSIELFNHAIIKVVTKGGKVLWVDPTNFASMAQGVFFDIADRPALVLNSQKPSYEDIPNTDYHHAKVLVDSIDNIKEMAISSKGKIVLSGEQALGLTGRALSSSQQAIEEDIIYLLSGELTPLRREVKLPNLSSRIVRDLEIEFSYTTDKELLVTNNGLGVPLTSGWASAFLDIADDQKGALLLSSPYTVENKTILKNVDAYNLDQLNFKVQNRWINAERTCRKVGKDIEILSRVERLQSYILAEELNSPEYINFKKELVKRCGKAALILKPETVN
jgi:hypothetical protein